MSKHTPGPWRWESNRLYGGENFYDDVFDLDVDCMQYCLGGTARVTDLSEANARLIAAAPEMLAALQAVWKDDWSDQFSHSLQSKIDDAIAKATQPND